MTIADAITLYLADTPSEWVAGHTFEKADITGTWTGVRGTRTARDLAQAGKHKIGDVTYFIERKEFPAQNKKGHLKHYAHYRVVSSEVVTPRPIGYIDENKGVFILQESLL